MMHWKPSSPVAKPPSSGARAALQACLKRHEERERWLDERVCEECALGKIGMGHEVRHDDLGDAIVSVLVPRRVEGSSKIVTLVVDMSQDFKEYRCPECGAFEEFLGLRRRDCFPS